MFTVCPASAAGHTAKAAGHTARTAGHTARTAGHTARTAGHTARTAGHTARTTGHPAKAAGHTKIYKGQRKSSFSIQFINNIRYFASINQTKKYKIQLDGYLLQLKNNGNNAEKILEEIKKCELLCANCHAEIHAQNHFE